MILLSCSTTTLPEHAGIGVLLVKVGVFDAIAGICEVETHAVSRVSIYALLQGQEVACLLAHFFAVQGREHKFGGCISRLKFLNVKSNHLKLLSYWVWCLQPSCGRILLYDAAFMIIDHALHAFSIFTQKTGNFLTLKHVIDRYWSASMYLNLADACKSDDDTNFD